MLKFAKFFFEPFPYRLLVYGQQQFAIIGRTFLYLEDVVPNFKLPFMCLVLV